MPTITTERGEEISVRGGLSRSSPSACTSWLPSAGSTTSQGRDADLPLVAAHAMTLRPSSPLVAEPPRTRELELSGAGPVLRYDKAFQRGLVPRNWPGFVSPLRPVIASR
jgi:hypothetical protein